MTQSNNIFLEYGEIDFDNLSNYERFQLEKYGNILRESPRPFALTADDDDRLSTSEESYIFSLENNEA